MKKKIKWSVTQLITAGSFGVLRFLLWLPFIALFSTSLNPLPTVFSLFYTSILCAISFLIIRRFGTITIQTLVEYVLELPLPSMTFKLLAFISAVVRSLIVDFAFYSLKEREKLSSLLCGGLNSIILSFFYYLIYLVMGIPGADKVPSIIFSPIGLIITFTIVFGIGAIGGYVGYLIYQRLKNTSVIKRIQG